MSKTYHAYHIIKIMVRIVLPTFGVLFYISTYTFWHGSDTGDVLGILVMTQLILGVWLTLSSRKYRKTREGRMIGFIDVDKTETGTKMMLNYPGDPADIEFCDRVTFKVRVKEHTDL